MTEEKQKNPEEVREFEEPAPVSIPVSGKVNIDGEMLFRVNDEDGTPLLELMQDEATTQRIVTDFNAVSTDTDYMNRVNSVFNDFPSWFMAAVSSGLTLYAMLPVILLNTIEPIVKQIRAADPERKKVKLYDYFPLEDGKDFPAWPAVYEYLTGEKPPMPKKPKVSEVNPKYFRQGTNKETQAIGKLEFDTEYPIYVGESGKGIAKKKIYNSIMLSKEEVPPEIADQLQTKLTSTQLETALSLGSLREEWESMGNSGDSIFSLSQIAEHCGRPWIRHAEKQDALIRELDIIRTCPLIYDNEEEAKKYHLTRLRLHDYVVNGKIITAEKDGNVTTAFIMHEQSPIYRIAKNKKQLTAYPLWVRKVPVSRSITTTALLDALLSWLTFNARNPSIKWETLFFNAGVSPRNAARKKDYVRAMLNYWAGDNEKQEKFIPSYSITKDGITVPKRGVALQEGKTE